MIKNLGHIRKIVGGLVHRGASAIRFKPQALTRLYKEKGTPTRAMAREIVKARQIHVIPKKVRRYKILTSAQYTPRRQALRREGVRVVIRKIHLSDRLRDKTISDKDRWMYHVRAARKLLREHRVRLGAQYRKKYAQVKGGYYLKRIKDLEKELLS